MYDRKPGAGVAEAVPGKACQYDALVKQADVKVTGTGKAFINASVEDVTGRIECIQWDPTEQDVDAFTNYDVVWLQGKCGTYKDKPQITVQSVFALGPDHIDWEHVLKSSPVDFQRMKDHLVAVIDLIRTSGRHGISKPLAEIVQALTTTDEFLYSPAASFMHHAYIHGLLEHSLSVHKNATRFSGSGIEEVRAGGWGWDDDVVSAGALLHDVGKVQEYTRTGKRLPASKTLGHSLLGCEMFSQAAAYATIDQQIVDKVKHVIAAHHGRTEWGAIVEPQSPEAWLVHATDLADSHLFSGARKG